MQIHFFATLRQITGTKTVELPLAEGITVRLLMEKIVTHFPAMRAELLDEAGNLWPHVHVLVNGRDAEYLPQGLQTPVQPADVINVFPAVGGGAQMTHYTRDLRGIPLWLLREYLVELGGVAEGDQQVNGDGWQVTLTQLDDFRLGSLVVGEVRLEMVAREEVYEAFKPLLEKKLIRAGG